MGIEYFYKDIDCQQQKIGRGKRSTSTSPYG
jgi:hypothetical protein